MRFRQLVFGLTVSGVFLSTAIPAVHAMDPYTQGMIIDMLSGTLLGTPMGTYGPSGYGPYGSQGYDPYYDTPPPYSPYDVGGRGYYDPYQQRRHYDYRYRHKRQYKYDKAMRRLDRQEAEARAKADRRWYRDPMGYRKRMDKIDRKYAHKRYKVQRNTGYYGYGYR